MSISRSIAPIRLNMGCKYQLRRGPYRCMVCNNPVISKDDIYNHNYSMLRFLYPLYTNKEERYSDDI
jgi:hypothetical protein